MSKLVLSLMGLTLLGVIAFAFLNISENDALQSSRSTSTYSNANIGLAFNYPAGEDGYVIEERTPTQNSENLVQTVTLIPTAEQARLQASPPVGGEGPAVISINVFRNDKKLFPLVWAQENIAYSSYNLKMGTESEAVVGGANALKYRADGLYASNVYIVAHGEHMYVITGQFMDDASALFKDFEPIVQSMQFIPTKEQTETPAVSGKINIDAVCEGALIYMTFPNGAAADAFVKECKEGKHPEVIEKYKADMGLGSGAAI